MATYQSTHTGAEIDAAVDAVDDKLPLTGGTLTGALTVSADVTTTGDVHISNGKRIYVKDSVGTEVNGMYMSASNNLVIGTGTLDRTNYTYIYGTTGITVRVGGSAATDNALIINSSKNVGIGTSSPTCRLDVSGDAAISGSLTLGGQAVVSVFSGSTAPSSSTGSNGDIYIQTS